MATKKQESKIEEVVEKPPPLNLQQRVNQIMGKINYIKKDTSINFGKGSGFSVTGHDAVTKLIHPYLVEYGINIIPTMDEVVQTGNRSRVHMSFKWVNIDDPDDFFTTQAQADGVCNQDKGIGKAWSIAQRYTVLKTFHLETGEKDIEEYNDDANDLVEEFVEEVQATISNKEALALIDFAESLGLESYDVITAMNSNGWNKTTDIPKDALVGFKNALEDLASSEANV